MVKIPFCPNRNVITVSADTSMKVILDYRYIRACLVQLIISMLFTFIYYISFIYSKVWFQNRRAKMRRQLKLQGQCPGPYVKRDNDETSPKASKSLKHAERSDGEHWEKQQEAEGYPWTTQKLGKWERPEGPSSEELRSCSIAKLRAKAREHEAEIQGNVSMSGGTKQSQTQETDATHND